MTKTPTQRVEDVVKRGNLGYTEVVDGRQWPHTIASGEFVYADVARTLAADLEAAQRALAERSCPCVNGSPCGDDCSCMNPLSSRGCAHCASYGSKEQRERAARRIAAAIRNAGERASAASVQSPGRDTEAAPASPAPGSLCAPFPRMKEKWSDKEITELDNTLNKYQPAPDALVDEKLLRLVTEEAWQRWPVTHGFVASVEWAINEYIRRAK